MKMKVLWWLILLSYTLCHRAFADQIFPGHDDDQDFVVMPNKIEGILYVFCLRWRKPRVESLLLSSIQAT